MRCSGIPGELVGYMDESFLVTGSWEKIRTRYFTFTMMVTVWAGGTSVAQLCL